MDIRDIRYKHTRELVAKFGGVSAFAEKLGKSQSQVSQFAGVNPTKGIGNIISREIEQAFGLSRGSLDRANPGWFSASGVREEQKPYYSGVPLISSIQAGSWSEIVDTFQPGDAESWYPCPEKHSQNTFALRVEGDSMTSLIPGQKSYPPGTIIYVDPEKTVLNGSRVVAKVNGYEEATFKVYKEDMGIKKLVPINSAGYDPIDITDIDVTIVGVVIGKYEPE